MVVAPHLDGLFITLARARFRFLPTVLDGPKEATAMGGMIAHAKFPLDHLGDVRRGPDLPAEAERLRPLCQEPRQLGSLLWGQFRRSARRWLMAQRFWALGLALADPLTDGSFCDSQGLSNLFLWPSLLIQ